MQLRMGVTAYKVYPLFMPHSKNPCFEASQSLPAGSQQRLLFWLWKTDCMLPSSYLSTPVQNWSFLFRFHILRFAIHHHAAFKNQELSFRLLQFDRGSKFPFFRDSTQSPWSSPNPSELSLSLDACCSHHSDITNRWRSQSTLSRYHDNPRYQLVPCMLQLSRDWIFEFFEHWSQTLDNLHNQKSHSQAKVQLGIHRYHSLHKDCTHRRRKGHNQSSHSCHNHSRSPNRDHSHRRILHILHILRTLRSLHSRNHIHCIHCIHCIHLRSSHSLRHSIHSHHCRYSKVQALKVKNLCNIKIYTLEKEPTCRSSAIKPQYSEKHTTLNLSSRTGYHDLLQAVHQGLATAKRRQSNVKEKWSIHHPTKEKVQSFLVHL